MRGGRSVVVVAVLSVAVVGAPAAAGAAAPERGEGAGPLPEVDFAALSLSEPGRALAEESQLADAPRYALTADVDPGRGDVAGRLRADLPAPTDGTLRFRVFAGLLGSESGLAVDDVAIGRAAVDAQLDASLLTVPVPEGASGDRVDVSMRFSYRRPRSRPAATSSVGSARASIPPRSACSPATAAVPRSATGSPSGYHRPRRPTRSPTGSATSATSPPRSSGCA
jgi:hypothetical protein